MIAGFDLTRHVAIDAGGHQPGRSASEGPGRGAGHQRHDMLEVLREAVRIAHLDRPLGDWPWVVTRAPAAMMGLPRTGAIRIGAPADLILFRARSDIELLSRPQSDRNVLRAGRRIGTTPPGYRELDDALTGRAR